MEKYIADMKTALVNYKGMREKAEQLLKDVQAYYGDEALSRERERQEKKLKAERAGAEITIKNAHAEGVAILEKWGKLDGSRLTDDMKLFDAGLVTPEVFDQLKTKYRDNATMLSALKTQGEKLNQNKAIDAPVYDVSDIRTGADKLERLDTLKNQALDVLDMLDASGNYSDDWNKSLGAALSDETIAHFGEGE